MHESMHDGEVRHHDNGSYGSDWLAQQESNQSQGPSLPIPDPKNTPAALLLFLNVLSGTIGGHVVV